MTQASNIKSIRPLQPVQDDRREYDPTFNLDREVAKARKRMGPERWAELNREWA